MVRAILFDLDNTLADREAAQRRYCCRFAGRFLSDVPEVQRTAAIEEMAARNAWGYFDPQEFCDWLAARFPHTGLSAQALRQDYRDRLPPLFEPDPRVCRLVERLRADYTLAVVTNGSSAVQRAKLKHTQLASLFEHVLVSSECGCEKPDRAIFLQALERVGCAPREALFVGDHPHNDVAGAAAVGMSTCWVSFGRTFPAGLPAPDRVIESLARWEGP